MEFNPNATDFISGVSNAELVNNTMLTQSTSVAPTTFELTAVSSPMEMTRHGAVAAMTAAGSIQPDPAFPSLQETVTRHASAAFAAAQGSIQPDPTFPSLDDKRNQLIANADPLLRPAHMRTPTKPPQQHVVKTASQLVRELYTSQPRDPMSTPPHKKRAFEYQESDFPSLHDLTNKGVMERPGYSTMNLQRARARDTESNSTQSPPTTVPPSPAPYTPRAANSNLTPLGTPTKRHLGGRDPNVSIEPLHSTNQAIQASQQSLLRTSEDLGRTANTTVSQLSNLSDLVAKQIPEALTQLTNLNQEIASKTSQLHDLELSLATTRSPRAPHSRSGSFSRPARSRNPSTSSKPRSPSASPAARSHNKSLQEDLDRLRTRIEEKTAKIDALNSQERSVQDRLAKSKKVKQETDSAVNTARRTKVDLDTEVKSLKKDKDNLLKRISELRCKESAMESRKKDDDDAAAAAQAAKKETDSLNSKIADLKATLARLSADKRNLETTLAAHNLEVTTQRSNLHDLNQQLSQAAVNLRRTKEDHMTASNELNAINSAITEARMAYEEEQTTRQQQMTTTDNQIAELQQHLAALQQQYDTQKQQMTAQIDSLRADTDKLQRQNKEAAESLSDTLSSNSASLQSSAIKQSNALNAELEAVRNKVGAAKMRLTQVNKELTQATSDLQRVQADKTSTEDDLSITKSKLDLECKKLHDVLHALDSTKASHENSKTALNNANTELDKITRAVQDKTKDHQNLTAQVSKARSTLQELSSDITMARKNPIVPAPLSPIPMAHPSMMMEFDDATNTWVRPQGLPVTPGKSIPTQPPSSSNTVTVNPTITIQAPTTRDGDANIAQQAAAFFAQAGKDLTTYVNKEITQSQALLATQIQTMNATIADMKTTALKHFEVQKATYAQHFNDLEAMQVQFNQQKDTDAAIQIGQLKETLTEEFKATRQVDLLEPQIAKQQTQITLLQNALKEIDRLLKAQQSKKPGKASKKTQHIAEKQLQIASQLELQDIDANATEDDLARNQTKLYKTINDKIEDQHARVTRVMEDLRNDIHDPKTLFSIDPKTVAHKRPRDISTDTTIGKPPTKITPTVDTSRVPQEHLASVQETLSKLHPQQLQPGTQLQVPHDINHTEPIPNDQ